MKEIKCPQCGKVFKVDESGFADIVKQVRDEEFEKEIREREVLFQTDLEAQLKAQEAEKKLAVAEATANLEAKLSGLNAQLEVKLAKLKVQNEAELSEQKAQFKAELAEQKAQSDTELAETKAQSEAELTRLRAQVQASETKQQLAVTEAVSKVEKERDAVVMELRSKEAELKSKDDEQKLMKASIEEQYKEKLKLKDEQIAYYRDFKAKQSTKMVGESLEQHCEIEFNKLRATGFQHAYFEKDNDVRTGSKGDYIYREKDENGSEIISIMFEMKNEQDETATKKKNEDFLKELNKDREEKRCEYAVLVSLLEPDNELYNMGIVDKSHRYPKMYVIRPQFFIPIITILRNAAMNSMQYKAELALVRSQNVDITHFEENINKFKEGFARNYELASRKFKTAIDEIDKTILHLQKTKDALISSENNLRLANNKAEDLTIKRLTRGNPTMKEKFEALAQKKERADSIPKVEGMPEVETISETEGIPGAGSVEEVSDHDE